MVQFKVNIEGEKVCFSSDQVITVSYSGDVDTKVKLKNHPNPGESAEVCLRISPHTFDEMRKGKEDEVSVSGYGYERN